MVSGWNLEKLGSCSTTCMVSVLACGNKWIQVGTYRRPSSNFQRAWRGARTSGYITTWLAEENNRLYLVSVAFLENLWYLVIFSKKLIKLSQVWHHVTVFLKQNKWCFKPSFDMCIIQLKVPLTERSSSVKRVVVAHHALTHDWYNISLVTIVDAEWLFVLLCMWLTPPRRQTRLARVCCL